jgi:hypothetical protein
VTWAAAQQPHEQDAQECQSVLFHGLPPIILPPVA